MNYEKTDMPKSYLDVQHQRCVTFHFYGFVAALILTSERIMIIRFIIYTHFLLFILYIHNWSKTLAALSVGFYLLLFNVRTINVFVDIFYLNGF